MRQDLTEAEIRGLLARSEHAAAEGHSQVFFPYWTKDDAAKLRRLVGELERLRDREANVMHLHQLEGSY